MLTLAVAHNKVLLLCILISNLKRIMMTASSSVIIQNGTGPTRFLTCHIIKRCCHYSAKASCRQHSELIVLAQLAMTERCCGSHHTIISHLLHMMSSVDHTSIPMYGSIAPIQQGAHHQAHVTLSIATECKNVIKEAAIS